MLISMPNVGAVEHLLKGLGKEYRSIVVSKHNKLIYSIETEKSHIKIDDKRQLMQWIKDELSAETKPSTSSDTTNES